MISKLVLILFVVKVNCFQTEWELNQFNGLSQNIQYYDNIPDFKTSEEVIDDMRTKTKEWMNVNTVPGVVFGLSVKGKTVWTEGFGYTDIENNVKTDKNSVWRLASISKPLTAALIGTLMDRQLIDLNESIYHYLPKDFFPKKSFNEKPVDITVRQLLSHLGGLHMTQMFVDFSKVFKPSNVSQTIESLKNENLLSNPGTEFSYSNYGYQMLGAIIESVLKNSFQNEIQLLFEKLGMNSTFADIRGKIVKNRSRYYHFNDYITPGPLQNCDIYDDLWVYEGWWPSGGMVSTAGDLLTFGNAMISSFKGKNENFLSETTVDELWKPETIGVIKATPLNDNEYAKGWFITRIPDSNPFPYKKFIWHSGGLLGTSTMLILFPEQEVVGVAFANRGYSGGLDQLILYLAQNYYKFIK